MSKQPIFDSDILARNLGSRSFLTDDKLTAIAHERDIVLERTIGGTENFLPFSFLEEGSQIGRAVARIVVRQDKGSGPEVLGFGTGFMIAPQLLMTNAHVLPSSKFCKDTLVQFNFELDTLGNEKDPDTWQMAPDAFFVSSPKDELDFTIVGLQKKDRHAGEVHGFVNLKRNTAKVKLDEPVNLIQHPEGRRKEIVVQENKVTQFYEEGFLHYVADTLRGSSGSPVFNNQWELVALHHSGVIKKDDNGHPVIRNGACVYIANEGIRISSIVAFMETEAVPEEYRASVTPYLYS